MENTARHSSSCKGSLVFIFVLTFVIMSSFKANATISRRNVLRGILSLGTSPMLSSIPLVARSRDYSDLLRDIAEIRNLQWEVSQQHITKTTEFLKDYIIRLENLELVTPRIRQLRITRLQNLNRDLTKLIENQEQQNTDSTKKDDMLTDQGRDINSKLSSSLIYNISLVRSMLPQVLIHKVNSQVGYKTPTVLVTDSEFELLIDYFRLLIINLDRFDSDTIGYSLLNNLFKDANSWFSHLDSTDNSSSNFNLSCKALLL